MKVRKSFQLGQTEAVLLEKEAARLGLSQSETIRKLIIKATTTGYENTKIKQMEETFKSILEMYKTTLNQNRLLLLSLRYITETDNKVKEKILSLSKKDKEYAFIEFIIEGVKNV